VFDASAKTSLNDNLHCGKKLQQDLPGMNGRHESSQIRYEYSDTNSYETNNKKIKLNTSLSTTSLSPAVEAKEYSENILEK